MNAKVDTLSSSNQELSSVFDKAISNKMAYVIRDIKQESDNYLQGVKTSFSEQAKVLEENSAALMEKKNNNIGVLENMKFVFANIIFVLVSVVLSRALFYGLWDGLYIKNFYEWGSQWEWLKYTMWGLFAGVIGFIGWFVFRFIKFNFSNRH